MYAKYIKRIIDFFLSLIALIVLSPILLILTVVGAIVMRGNPFFVQPRPGKKDKYGKEKIFNLIKFRTMDNRKDDSGNLLPDNIRLNRYGRILRASSLDELPSLINIVKGELSIVGPRPLLVDYLPRYSATQRKRHNVRPGLTGFAQAYGRNLLTWEEKFDKDLYYVENVTLFLDIKIILKTIIIVLNRDGISSNTSATMEEFMGNELHTEKSDVEVTV